MSDTADAPRDRDNRSTTVTVTDTVQSAPVTQLAESPVERGTRAAKRLAGLRH